VGPCDRPADPKDEKRDDGRSDAISFSGLPKSWNLRERDIWVEGR
jgi:hypothetical protein